MANEGVKIVSLALFVLLVKYLEDPKKPVLGVVLFCVAFYLYMVIVMAAFGLTEEYDFAVGFLGASFVVLFGRL